MEVRTLATANLKHSEEFHSGPVGNKPLDKISNVFNGTQMKMNSLFLSSILESDLIFAK